MIINDNPMNPVPLWPNKDNWYCKKVTNHGACAHPVLPNGTLPAMMLTIPYQDTLPSSRPVMTARLGMIYEDERVIVIGEHVGQVTVTLNGTSVNIEQYDIVITPSDREGMFDVSITPPRITIPMFVQYISPEELRNGITINTTNPYVEFTYWLYIKVDMRVYALLSPVLYEVGRDVPMYSETRTELVELTPSNLRTNRRYATINIDERSIGGDYGDGVYYLAFNDSDGVTHYSEPFLWLTNIERHLHVIYRRSTPIVTTDNYIPFDVEGDKKTLSAYLPGRLMMPPFKFDVDVDEIDGMKYARKQVSYTQEHTEFYCTSYFAQAIRLLWHCDIRYAGLLRVDYMEPPQVDWKDDNHLCDVVLKFQCDTVMQTNGTASAYDDSSDSSHTSYDQSFDQSFA